MPLRPTAGLPEAPRRRRRSEGALGKNWRRRRQRRRAHPGQALAVWAQDEGRFGLQPVARRAWPLRGRRPRSYGRARYDWLYVYGFARPATGQTVAALLPRVNAERMGDARAALAARADPEGREVLVVLRDHAGWRVAKRLAVPANVVRHFRPPGTPERPPAEPLGPLVRAAVANRSIGRIDRLRAILRGRLAYLARNPAIVQPVVGCRWAARLEWEGINLIRYQSPGRNSRRCRRVWCWGAAAPSGVTPLL